MVVAIDGVAANVRLIHNGGVAGLERQPDSTWSTQVPASSLIADYRTGDLRNTAAVIQVLSTAGAQQTPVTINIRDNSVPPVSIDLLSGTVQAASHVVNIRYDSIYAGDLVPPELVRTLYRYFGDDFDFINVIEQVRSPLGPLYLAVRNAVSGLGLQTFTRTETYGSSARLQGILLFPDESFFDPAATSYLHQLAHRWMNFSNHPNLRTARPHWPISTLAYGIIGTENPVTGQEEIFRWELAPNSDGSYTVRAAAAPRSFNNFELYLMGLLPPDSVPPQVTFLDQNQRSELRNGGRLHGPTDTITVAEWVARDGVRSPPWPESQDTFRMATVVLSKGALLSSADLAFYNHLAARAESEVGLQTVSLSTRLSTLPFFLATGGRARLITRLRPPPL